jgi:hypothetical protein
MAWHKRSKEGEVRRQRQYYTLIASLPLLPPLERAERLPINRDRLQDRLRLLAPDDAAIVERAEAFITWQRQPLERTDAEVVAVFQALMLPGTPAALIEVVAFRMQQRTLMAALRRRQRGLPAPAADEPWGVGPWVAHIVRHWQEPDFRLGLLQPWVPQARAYLEAGDTLALERLLMQQVWTHLERLVQDNLFGFAAVLVYLFKWDMLQRWLSYNRPAAQVRFEALVGDITRDHQPLFP